MTRVAPREQPVTYAAVGATQAPDLMRFPPSGFRPVERRVRIGHGDARWDYACTQLFTWGVQRLSGMRVQPAEGGTFAVDDGYSPVHFDEQGAAVASAAIGGASEALFGPDGTPFLRAGDEVRLIIPFGPFRLGAPVRVVYVIDEPRRKGFGYGTLPGHPESGEEAWVIDQTEDGSVWMTIRAFSRPATKAWWAVYPVLRVVQDYFTRRYEHALGGTISE